jgi:hypothetical protein
MKRTVRILGACVLGLLVPLLALAQDEPATEPEPLPDTLILNEVELNPEGFDADKEWVEILNVSEAPVDLAGWQITANYRDDTILLMAEDSTLIPPGGRYIYTYEGLRLRNEGGTVVQLINPDGMVVDQTSPLEDTQDDERTWQRYPDGGDPLFPDMWWFLPASRNASND